MHDKTYIDDYKGMLLKRFKFICSNLATLQSILNMLFMLKNL